jgi:hypothetical protein
MSNNFERYKKDLENKENLDPACMEFEKISVTRKKVIEIAWKERRSIESVLAALHEFDDMVKNYKPSKKYGIVRYANPVTGTTIKVVRTTSERMAVTVKRMTISFNIVPIQNAFAIELD